MLKVLHVADYPVSAAPYRLMQVQRLTGVDARVINLRVHFATQSYPSDVLLLENPDLAIQLLADADVIHYHKWWRQSALFKLFPAAWDIARRKPSVIQFHSPRRAEFEEALSERSLVKLVVAQYQARLYPECQVVPNAVPIHEPLYRPLNAVNSPPVVAFSPSDCIRKGWYDKGCEETLAVLRQSGISFRFIHGIPFTAALRLRQGCDIAIDEVVTGSYHMTSLESLSQGLATVAGLDSQTIDALEIVTGTRQHPWVVANLQTLKETLTALVSDERYRLEKRREARKYIEQYWNPPRVSQMYRTVYDQALELHSRCALPPL